jgi:hypothetical protein
LSGNGVHRRIVTEKYNKNVWNVAETDYTGQYKNNAFLLHIYVTVPTPYLQIHHKTQQTDDFHSPKHWVFHLSSKGLIQIKGDWVEMAFTEELLQKNITKMCEMLPKQTTLDNTRTMQ